MRDSSHILLDTLGDVVPVVTGVPGNVADFVQKKKVVEESQTGLEGYKNEQKHIDEMASLMNEMGWPIPDDEKAHLNMIASEMLTLENGIEIAQGKEEEDTIRFAQDIEAEIPKLNKDIQTIKETLDKPLISSLEYYENTTDVIAFLEKQEEFLRGKSERSETLQEYQGYVVTRPSRASKANESYWVYCQAPFYRSYI